MKNDVSLAITLGNQTDLAITLGNDLIIKQEYAPGLSHRINLGRCTKKRIEDLQEYLGRLKCHAVSE